MKKVKVKGYSKVNLTLDVLGEKGGYHNIQSLVASIDLFDAIAITKRNDNQITLKTTGVEVGCDTEKNTAFKAVCLYQKKYFEKFADLIALGEKVTCGVDIVINKNIPVGGGLGGSSSDIAGVILGMEKLYEGGFDLVELANALGSDSGFLIKGGFALISGRGDKIQWLTGLPKLFFIIKSASEMVSAKDSYGEFDKLAENLNLTKPQKESELFTFNAMSKLKEKDVDGFIQSFGNDLTLASVNLVPEIKENLDTLSCFGKAIMSGSGSCVYAVFKTKKERDFAYKKLIDKGEQNLIKTQTI